MKAIICTKYGSPEVLKLLDVENTLKITQQLKKQDGSH
jgi:hypothetical protein